jgi:hypothetical protein
MCVGSFILLGAIILLAAGCDPGLGPETGSGSSPQVDENGNYIIKVNTTGMAARSIAAADASLLAKEYEIVCHDGTSFYSGYAKNDAPLTVSLPEGEHYAMLLLAGNGSRVLLGTGWLGDQAIGPDTGSVTIHVKPLTILDTKMAFDDNHAPAPDTINTTGTPPLFQVVSGSTALTTTFELQNMDALEYAAAALASSINDIYTAANGFATKEVVLHYYDDDHENQIVRTSLTTTAGGTSAVRTLTFPDLSYVDSAPNWSALVYLNLRYVPFSQNSTSLPAGITRTWSIMNGTGRNASNGAVKVKAGNGGTVTIDVNTDL